MGPKRIALCLLFASSTLLAQQASQALVPSPVRSFEFSKPADVISLSRMPVIAGRFECTPRGGVVTLVDIANGTTSPDEQLAVVLIKPDGHTIQFHWNAVPGYSSVSVPRHIFAAKDGIYILVTARKDLVDSGAANYDAGIPLVLRFTDEGSLDRVTPLSPDLHPISFGVFPSGKYLILAEDRLNRRMTASILSADGTYIGDLDLKGAASALGQGPHAKGPEGPVTYDPHALVELTEIFSYGKNLLLVPHATSSVPILEISETGIVHVTIPKLPDGTIDEMFIPSDSRTFKLQLGTLYENSRQPRSPDSLLLGATTRPSQHIVELDPVKGHILQEMDAVSGVQPACESNGVFTFLTGDQQTGFLQIVQAKLR